MRDTPETIELVQAVRGFVDSLCSELTGHAAFHARVAANVLDIVAREIARDGTRRVTEQAALAALLGRDGDADSLAETLCRDIRAGAMAIDDPRLLDFLDRLTLGRLDVDQPGYSGARIAREAG